MRPIAVGGDSRPKGDLGNRQPALLEGRRHRHRRVDFLEHDDGDDAPDQNRPQDVVLSHLIPRED